MQNIAIGDLKNRLYNSKIIDIRNKTSYEIEHIESAINVNKLDLISNPDKYINKNEIIYIYCETGMNSSRICSTLNLKGYHTINVLGGFKAWKKLK